jgi:hypothetical protein
MYISYRRDNLCRLGGNIEQLLIHKFGVTDGLEICDRLVEEVKRVQGCDDLSYLIAALDQVLYMYVH